MECEPELLLNFVHGNLTCSLPRKQGQTDPAWPRGPNGTPACCRKPTGIFLPGSDPEWLLQSVIPCVCPLLSQLTLSALQPLLTSPKHICPFRTAVCLLFIGKSVLRREEQQCFPHRRRKPAFVFTDWLRQCVCVLAIRNSGAPAPHQPMWKVSPFNFWSYDSLRVLSFSERLKKDIVGI